MERLWSQGLSLSAIANHYRARVAVTWLLLLLDAGLMLLFPLAIGFTVDTLQQGDYRGVSYLIVLCLAVLVFGAGRRFYDTRVYARIYRELAASLVARQQRSGVAVSALTAKVSLLYEVVEFFEQYVPELIAGVVAFFGVLGLLALIDWQLVVLCLGASALVVVIYALTGARILDYNRAHNDELERQVDVLAAAKPRRTRLHFGRLMQWNIRLSDLETWSFSAVWLVLASLVIVAMILIVQNPVITAGNKLTAIMYVWQYIEVVMGFPLIYQQLVRLQEIAQRLSALPAPAEQQT
jgi:ABC-type multidrug transport system fused ATPase/permease subunit